MTGKIQGGALPSHVDLSSQGGYITYLRLIFAFWMRSRPQTGPQWQLGPTFLSLCSIAPLSSLALSPVAFGQLHIPSRQNSCSPPANSFSAYKSKTQLPHNETSPDLRLLRQSWPGVAIRYICSHTHTQHSDSVAQGRKHPCF